MVANWTCEWWQIGPVSGGKDGPVSGGKVGNLSVVIKLDFPFQW